MTINDDFIASDIWILWLIQDFLLHDNCDNASILYLTFHLSNPIKIDVNLVTG